MILETELKQLILKMKEKKEQHEVLKVKMELERKQDSLKIEKNLNSDKKTKIISQNELDEIQSKIQILDMDKE